MAKIVRYGRHFANCAMNDDYKNMAT